jgi:hypothetical protein
MSRRPRQIVSAPALAVLCLLAAPPGAAAQTAEPNEQAQAARPPEPRRRTMTSSGFVGALNASLRLLMMEHTGRILFQEKTRRELGGPFFTDWTRSVRVPATWGDGDSVFVNYFGHPLHGAAAGRAWLVHHPENAREIGRTAAYWKSRLGATAWAALYSLQFEVGPLSEASIGNVGLRRDTAGWVDHVVTPLGALGFIVGEDAVDLYAIQFVERHTTNRWLRGTVRVFLNPSRALANVADLRTPWYRVRGPLHMRY